jgi:hypothetical protein
MRFGRSPPTFTALPLSEMKFDPPVIRFETGRMKFEAELGLYERSEVSSHQEVKFNAETP